MHTAVHPRHAGSSGAAAKAVRIAVAGATGYTGQELLRILSRHPAVTIVAATSSGATSATTRKLPALAHVFTGTITPLDPAALANDAELVFLALPDKAAAELTRIKNLPNLKVGKTAPEIVGEDIDGKQFKLSDYRGKVVLLDFWGHW